MKKSLILALLIILVSSIGVFGYYLMGSNFGVSADEPFGPDPPVGFDINQPATTGQQNIPDSGRTDGFDYEALSPDTLNKIDYSPGSWQQFGTNIISLLSYIAGTALVIVLLIGGVMYITSAGNDEQANKAKTVMFNAIIGITIVAVAYSIVVFIANTIK